MLRPGRISIGVLGLPGHLFALRKAENAAFERCRAISVLRGRAVQFLFGTSQISSCVKHRKVAVVIAACFCRLPKSSKCYLLVAEAPGQYDLARVVSDVDPDRGRPVRDLNERYLAFGFQDSGCAGHKDPNRRGILCIGC